MSVTHFEHPDNGNFTACGLSRYKYILNISNTVDNVDCGNCVWTDAYKDAKYNSMNSKTETSIEEDWETPRPDEGYYWVSDGYEMYIAFSDGSDWYKNDYDWEFFTEIDIEYFKRIPQPPLP